MIGAQITDAINVSMGPIFLNPTRPDPISKQTHPSRPTNIREWHDPAQTAAAQHSVFQMLITDPVCTLKSAQIWYAAYKWTY